MAQLNPYLKQRKSRKINRLALFLLAFPALAGLGYFFLFARYFLVKDIEVQIEFPGQQRLKDEANILINHQKFWLIPPNNIFFNPKKYLLKKLTQSFPELKNLDWSYDFFTQELLLTGELREPAVKICQNQRCFFVDFFGIAFETDNHLIEERAFISLEDQTTESPVWGQVFLPPKMISFVYELKNLIKDELQFDKIILEPDFLKAGFFKVLTDEGWSMLLSFEFEPRLIAENLKLMLEKELKDSRSKLEYLDLRYSNKAFYKLK